MEVGERIEAICNYAIKEGYVKNVNQFAVEADICRQSIDSYTKLGCIPSIEVAGKICSTFGVSPHFILFGTGEMVESPIKNLKLKAQRRLSRGVARSIEAHEEYKKAKHDVRIFKKHLSEIRKTTKGL